MKSLEIRCKTYNKHLQKWVSFINMTFKTLLSFRAMVLVLMSEKVVSGQVEVKWMSGANEN